jgi:hypothetical protein
MPKSELRTVNDHGEIYTALAFICPGCASHGYGTGLHMLPVNSPHHQPSWEWDGNLDLPTLSPSILTNSSWKGEPTVCHSFLKAGVFQFLGDCTHKLANQYVEIPDLPDWVTDHG